MANKGAKKKAKRQKAQPSVLGSLPGQRPQRLGGTRPARTAAPVAPPPPAQQTPPPAARPTRPAAARKKPAPPPPPPRRHTSPPRGTELVTTAIQAAGELAQIGLTAGGKAVKRAVDRIPRP